MTRETDRTTGSRDTGPPGGLMAAEIAEQPQVWRRVLDEGMPAVRAAAEAIRRHAPRFVLLGARGTSDHAALYAKYLVEITHQLPAGLLSPSTMTVYGARPDLRGALVVAVSQSGASPDLVRSVEVARAQGALTLAVTNASDSPLADAAELHVAVLAGAERSVAATKTYTAQLLVLHLVLAVARGADTSAALRLPELAAEVLDRSGEVDPAVDRLRFARRLVTTGRGFAYPTAREAALKLMETAYVSAQAFSGADLVHGPVAMVDADVPVLAVAPDGRAGRAMAPLLARFQREGVEVVCVGSSAAVAGCGTGFELPAHVPEPLSPLLEVLPLQQLALRLAVARGGDPDTPRGLSKVTETL